MKLPFLPFWILSCHAATCLAAAGAAQVFSEPIVPANPEAAGKELAARLLSMRPSEGTNHATLTIQANKTKQVTLPLQIEVTVSDSAWITTYVRPEAAGQRESRYIVVRGLDGSTKYQIQSNMGSDAPAWLQGQAGVLPIAGSDFTLADVGMEFLRWPTQRLVKKEVCRTQSCDKLESIAPPGWTNGYSRVASWFDIDTGGPVLIQAYAGKTMVKEFRPTKFEKKDGQYQVEELEINDLLTKSRSTLRFGLKSSAP